MKLGISSYSFTWAVGVNGHFPQVCLNETDLLAKAQELGVNLVQISDNLPLHRMSGDRISQLVENAERLDIELEAGANNMTSENLELYIHLAQKIKSKILRFVIDGEGFAPDVDQIVSIVRNAEPELKKRNLILAIENHDRLYSYQFEDVITKVGSPFVAMCLDCANSLGLGEGIHEVVSRLAPYSVNFHVKEVFIKRKFHKMGFDIEGRPFGEGTLPIEWMLEQLPSKCRTAILEQWTPPEDSVVKTIEKEKEWARQSIQFLRKYIHE